MFLLDQAGCKVSSKRTVISRASNPRKCLETNALRRRLLLWQRNLTALDRALVSSQVLINQSL